MSDPRKFALYGGILMIIVGAAALVPNLYTTAGDLPRLNLEASYGYFLGQIPMNITNKIALIAFGVMGIAAANWKYKSLPMSIRYSRFVMVVMAVLTVLGLFEQTNTLFGYWPLWGANVVLYAVVAVVAGYYGFRLSSTVPDTYKEHDARMDMNHAHAKRHFKSPVHFGHHH